MGNKSFPVNSEVLRQKREDKGWTQRDVGIKLAKRLNKESQHPEDSAKHYQRIERRGKTSLKTLDILASIFGVTRAVLQGQEIPDPVEYEQQIRSLLRQAIDQGGNETLNNSILRESEHNPDISHEDALSNLACKIASRIENAQLTYNPSVLADLVTLTGIPEEELLRPANINGYWFITASGRSIHASEVVHGWPAIEMHIPKILGDSLEGIETDSLIRVRRDLPWYRIEIKHPRNGMIRIDIVRCKPERNGLRWQSPSWDEKWWLESALTNWAKTTANFVALFDETIIPGDFKKLRFRVTEYDSLGKSNVIAQRVISADLNEIPVPLLESVQESGQMHQLALNWLKNELDSYLRSLLTEFPSSRQSISGPSHIGITLWASKSAQHQTSDRFYQIDLVEEVNPGEFVIAPFRERDRAVLEDSIKTWLK